MYKLSGRLLWLSVVSSLVLAGCQGADPSQGVRGSVDQGKVASVLTQYEAATGDWAGSYANLSIAEMKVFIDLEHQRALKKFEALERNPFEERDVLLDAAGRVVERYDPAGRIETRRVRLTAEELSQRRGDLNQYYRLRLALHELSVARHGVSFNAVNGAQLDSLIKDARAQMGDLTAQQSCTYNPNVYPRSGTVPYIGVSALPRTMRYIGTISDGGCDPFYVISGSTSVTRLSQNPSSSETCISRLARLPLGQAVTNYARRRAAQESASRFIIGPGDRISAFCANNFNNWARSARAN